MLHYQRFTLHQTDEITLATLDYHSHHITLSLSSDKLIQTDYQFQLPYHYDKLKHLIRDLLTFLLDYAYELQQGYQPTDKWLLKRFDLIEEYLTNNPLVNCKQGAYRARIKWIPEHLPQSPLKSFYVRYGEILRGFKKLSLIRHETDILPTCDFIKLLHRYDHHYLMDKGVLKPTHLHHK